MTAPKMRTKRNEHRGHEEFAVKIDGDTKIVGHHRLLCLVEHTLDEMDGMVVHHKNGIPWDNRLENLELMTQSEHATLHSTKNYTQEDCIEAIKEVIKENDGTISSNIYEKSGKSPCLSKIYDLWSTWGMAKNVAAKELDITVKSPSQIIEKDEPWHDENTLREAYHDSPTQEEVAKKFNTSVDTIIHWMQKLGVEAVHPLKKNKKLLLHEYKELGSQQKVADKHNCSQQSVSNWIEETQNGLKDEILSN